MTTPRGPGSERKCESIWRYTSGDIPIPIVDDVIIDDGAPVESIFIEKQRRLLTSPLYDSWSGPEPRVPFVVLANVGLFFTAGEEPLVPDVMLSLDVCQSSDLRVKENQSYFVWHRSKVPDVVIEVVANTEGGEDAHKFQAYARIRVSYYVVFDPENLLGGGVLRVFQLQGRRYRQLAEPFFFEDVDLGVVLWQGQFERANATWLRWCDREGKPIPTTAEQVEQIDKRIRAEERQAAINTENERLEAKLRAAGIDPDADEP